MTAAVTFTVTHPQNRRVVISREVAGIAGRVSDAAAGNTPRDTGLMAGSWRLVAGRDPGTTLVVNEVPYARYVEYGPVGAAPLGRAIAAARR